MSFVNTPDSGLSQVMPPGVTPITELRQQKRVSKTLSKAVSLHLEGKLESAARLLAKAVESGEKEASIYSALGDIQYEMREPMLYGCHPRIVETVQVTAARLFFRSACTGIIPCLHRDTHHFIPLVVQHESRNGTVNTATHRYQDFSFTAHKK